MNEQRVAANAANLRDLLSDKKKMREIAEKVKNGAKKSLEIGASCSRVVQRRGVHCASIY